jgi:hypothetical protein
MKSKDSMYSFLLKNKYLIQRTIIFAAPFIVDVAIDLLAKHKNKKNLSKNTIEVIDGN